MVSSRARRKSPAVQTPDETRQSDRRRTSRTGRAARDAEQHSEASATSSKATLKRYLIVIEKANGNYGAYAPDLPGCGALGDTIEETLVKMKRAIEMHVKAMLDDGDEIPDPSTIGDYIEVREPLKRKAG